MMEQVPGLRPMSPEQRKELVAVYGESIVSRAEREQKGKGYGAIAIYSAELESISMSKGGAKMMFTVGKVIKEVTPVLPNYGPPLPRFFNVKWPQAVYNRLPGVVHEVSRIYNGLLSKLPG